MKEKQQWCGTFARFIKGLIPRICPASQAAVTRSGLSFQAEQGEQVGLTLQIPLYPRGLS